MTIISLVELLLAYRELKSLINALTQRLRRWAKSFKVSMKEIAARYPNSSVIVRLAEAKLRLARNLHRQGQALITESWAISGPRPEVTHQDYVRGQTAYESKIAERDFTREAFEKYQVELEKLAKVYYERTECIRQLNQVNLEKAETENLLWQARYLQLEGKFKSSEDQVLKLKKTISGLRPESKPTMPSPPLEEKAEVSKPSLEIEAIAPSPPVEDKRDVFKTPKGGVKYIGRPVLRTETFDEYWTLYNAGIPKRQTRSSVKKALYVAFIYGDPAPYSWDPRERNWVPSSGPKGSLQKRGAPAEPSKRAPRKS
jgi:hypothetical protein